MRRGRGTCPTCNRTAALRRCSDTTDYVIGYHLRGLDRCPGIGSAPLDTEGDAKDARVPAGKPA